MDNEEEPDEQMKYILKTRMTILGIGDDTLEQQAVHVTLEQRMKEADDVVVEEEEDNEDETDQYL